MVLELFTSEGCSSCPPADKLLATLDESQPFANADLVVLSEHVDYWNGSAWRDPYSSSIFTERQRQYAMRLGSEVYTPQLVIDGRSEGVGSNGATVKAGIEKALAEQKLRLSITNIAIRDGKLTFRAVSPDAAPKGTLTLYVALAENNAQTNVRGGENGGRILSHVAVVRSLTSAGSLSSGGLLDKAVAIRLPRSIQTENLRVVAFLQASGNGPIFGATQERLKDLPPNNITSTK